MAGRRGGKTLSAAWEVVYYAMHPEQFHWDRHKKQSDRPLHIWVLTPDYRSSGRAALFTLRDVLRQAGLIYGKDYQENRGEKWIEFANGSMIEFKTAERPEQLVGAGLDMLWMDEAAVVPDDNAWNVARPALSDKQGMVICTTTPRGKNWLYEMFWNENQLRNPDIGRVEYRSIDNPHFPQDEWEEARRDYHPIMFKREYMASFDALSGVELQGDWLVYYEIDDLPRKGKDEKVGDLPYDAYDLDIYMGIDPASSLSDKADHFVIAVIGVSKSNTVYLLDLYMDRIPFPEQVDKIKEYFLKYRPTYIAIESNAYQRVLAQQVERLESMPPVLAVFAKGEKSERILSMAPLFKIGKVKVRKDQTAFIDQWLSYDSTLKNPKDDALDAVEVAIRAVGALLPSMLPVTTDFFPRPASDVHELAQRDLAAFTGKREAWDPELGADF